MKHASQSFIKLCMETALKRCCSLLLAVCQVCLMKNLLLWGLRILLQQTWAPRDLSHIVVKQHMASVAKQIKMIQSSNNEDL